MVKHDTSTLKKRVLTHLVLMLSTTPFSSTTSLNLSTIFKGVGGGGTPYFGNHDIYFFYFQQFFKGLPQGGLVPTPLHGMHLKCFSSTRLYVINIIISSHTICRVLAAREPAVACLVPVLSLSCKSLAKALASLSS